MALESVKLITLFFFFLRKSVLVTSFWEAHEYLIPCISNQSLKPQWKYSLIVENPSNRDDFFLEKQERSCPYLFISAPAKQPLVNDSV